MSDIKAGADLRASTIAMVKRRIQDMKNMKLSRKGKYLSHIKRVIDEDTVLLARLKKLDKTLRT